jgi:hypothetical protein
MNFKEYIGDSVYVAFDGYSFVLTTENGYGPSNTIVLEPEVLNALLSFRQRTYAHLKAESQAKTP